MQTINIPVILCGRTQTLVDKISTSGLFSENEQNYLVRLILTAEVNDSLLEACVFGTDDSKKHLSYKI